ncbi:hypothetical protein SCLCIDRAFT_1207164 [Scleroderma citrinum Foug A]|uniref:Uncharacterized protein n=1 Tax=Scleroderma citrinum Foug A TaxID=1036808 RepID=A0A0C3EPY2_9AGAM|nr:hypothetical protein SCLCIDRAFT_1207164 [Scleroderma citrinum Foug A]
MPYNLSFIGVHFDLGKLYANSLLASINAREMIKRPHPYNTTGASHQAVIFPSNFGMDQSENPTTTSATPARMKGIYPIQVNVERTIASMVDANVDAPSDLDVVSEQVYRLDNGDQKGGTSV